jgi:hypothetical protein
MNDALQIYVQENLARGHSKKIISRELLKAGWKKEDITIALQQSTNVTVQSSTFTDRLIEKNLCIPLSMLPNLMLRIGLAFVFTFAAITISLNPTDGESYLPGFVSIMVPSKVFLTCFGIYEIFLSFWLLSGKNKVYSGFLAAITIFSITIFNLESFDILFRNVAIFFAGLSLGFMGLTERVRDKKEA